MPSTSSQNSDTTRVAQSLSYVQGGFEHWGNHSYLSDCGAKTGHDELEPDAEARLERELEGEGSDSSIDLHTPLPFVFILDK